MKKLSSIFFILVVFAISNGFVIDSDVKSKIKKEANRIWEVKDVNVKRVKLKDLALSNDVYKIISNNNIIGFAYLGQADSRSEKIDFLIIFNKQAQIEAVKVIAYRENYGGEVASKRWLRQFIGKSNGQKMKLREDISVISGATISVNSLNKAIQDASVLIYQNKDFLNQKEDI